MIRVRKKPVEVEAWPVAWLLQAAKVNAPTFPQVVMDAYLGSTINLHADYLSIQTMEGVMRADATDWLIMGVAGEFYPCKPDIFAATYEEVDDDT